MANLFFYKSTYKNNSGQETVEEGSFNVNNIVRTLQRDGMYSILLNDGHEETMIYEVTGKNNKVEEKRIREWRVSTILLTDEKDIARFKEYFR